MSSYADHRAPSTASLGWAAVGALCLVLSGHLAFWVFRWMNRKRPHGMDVRADDRWALTAQVFFATYAGVVIRYGLVGGSVEILQGGRVASQLAIVCSQVSQVFNYSRTFPSERRWLLRTRLATVLVAGFVSLVLVSTDWGHHSELWKAMLTAGSTLAAECITSGFLISLQVAKIRAGKSAVKITWVQGICLLVWMLRIGGPCGMLATTPFSTEGVPPTQPPWADWTRLFASVIATLIAPGAGLFSAWRRWYTPWKTAQEDSVRTRPSALSLTSGGAGRTTSKRTSVTEEAASRNGSSAPLVGHNIRRAWSSSALSTSCDSLEGAAPALPAIPASVHMNDSAGAVPVGGSTILSSLPSAGALGEMPEQGHEGGGIMPAGFRFVRLHGLGEAGALEPLMEILGRHAGCMFELEDGSFEISVHQDHFAAMEASLSSAFPGSTVDLAYSPLVGTGGAPDHIARLAFRFRFARMCEMMHPHAMFYKHWAEKGAES